MSYAQFAPLGSRTIFSHLSSPRLPSQYSTTIDIGERVADCKSKTHIGIYGRLQKPQSRSPSVKGVLPRALTEKMLRNIWNILFFILKALCALHGSLLFIIPSLSIQWLDNMFLQNQRPKHGFLCISWLHILLNDRSHLMLCMIKTIADISCKGLKNWALNIACLTVWCYFNLLLTVWLFLYRRF